MNQPVVIINGEEEPQDPGTTLADLRASFPTCYLTSVENGRQVTHRASSYVLGNQIYTLHIPALTPSAVGDSALLKEIQKIEEGLHTVALTQHVMNERLPKITEVYESIFKLHHHKIKGN